VRRLKRDKVVKIARLSSCKNFVSKREKFISDDSIFNRPYKTNYKSAIVSISVSCTIFRVV